jgi:hypothetical protein
MKNLTAGKARHAQTDVLGRACHVRRRGTDEERVRPLPKRMRPESVCWQLSWRLLRIRIGVDGL